MDEPAETGAEDLGDLKESPAQTLAAFATEHLVSEKKPPVAALAALWISNVIDAAAQPGQLPPK